MTPSESPSRDAVEAKEAITGDNEAALTSTPPDEECRAFKDMCFLALAYSANLGGTGSLTGTGPNLVTKAVLSRSLSIALYGCALICSNQQHTVTDWHFLLAKAWFTSLIVRGRSTVENVGVLWLVHGRFPVAVKKSYSSLRQSAGWLFSSGL